MLPRLDRVGLLVAVVSVSFFACICSAGVDEYIPTSVTFTTEAPNVYPLVPDGKSHGTLTAYNRFGGIVQLTWSFADGDTHGCQITPEGEFFAGAEEGEVKVKGQGEEGAKYPIIRTIKVACGAECEGCQEPGSGTFELGSVDMTFNLGKASRLGSAGTLIIKADEESDWPSTPAGLDLGVLNGLADVESIRDLATGNLLQVCNNAQAMVDIVPNGAHEYSVSYYHPN